VNLDPPPLLHKPKPINARLNNKTRRAAITPHANSTLLSRTLLSQVRKLTNLTPNCDFLRNNYCYNINMGQKTDVTRIGGNPAEAIYTLPEATG